MRLSTQIQIMGMAFSSAVLQANALPSLLQATPQQSAPACVEGATIENLWRVQQLNVNYTDDERVRRGNATFTITNNLTNITESIRCSLRANYVCEVYGTPAQETLQIWLQINLGVARFTLNQTVDCSSEQGPRYV